MQFSTNFLVHFVLSFAGFVALGVFLCRGSWRNSLRAPLALALILLGFSHLLSFPGGVITATYAAVLMLGIGMFAYYFLQTEFKPSDVREGHNVLSLMVGAALFALTIQLHFVLFGVPVFTLVR